jgi:CRISPR-associated protein Cas1
MEDIMERFYVLEAGTTLRKSGEHLVVTRGGDQVAQIPLEGLQQLTLLGYSSLTGAVLDTLIRHRIETVLLSPRGRFRGRLMVDEHKHVQRRQAQYLRLSEAPTALAVARSIVQGKLRNSARFLALRGAQYDDPELQRAAVRIKALIHMIPQAADLDVLRGIEGHGASIYYRAFPRLIRVDGFPFTTRSRRPPLDPVNALLSFVYTLLTLEVLTAVKTVGLDPYFGALHAVDYGRPSLACDLVEEWRAFLGDRLVLSLINRQILSPDDFILRSVTDTDAVDEEDLKRKRPVEMKPKICRAFIETYEKWMASTATFPGEEQKSDYRGFIRHQVRRFNEYLLSEREQYEPFVWSQVF